MTPRCGAVLALLAVLLLGAGAAGTLAGWTDSEAVAAGQVDSGELHLDLGPGNVRVKPEQFAWTTMSMTNMYPGASTAATLRVANNSSGGTYRGGLPLRYTVSASVTLTGGGGVTDTGLVVTIRKNGTLSGGVCSGGTVITSGDTRLSTTTTKTVVSSAQTVSQAAFDTLCVTVTMATNTANAMQGATAVVRLDFPAEGVNR